MVAVLLNENLGVGLVTGALEGVEGVLIEVQSSNLTQGKQLLIIHI